MTTKACPECREPLPSHGTCFNCGYIEPSQQRQTWTEVRDEPETESPADSPDTSRYAAIVATRSAEGATHNEIVEALEAEGLRRADAEAVISDLQRSYIESRDEENRSEATRHFRWGAIWLVGGIAVTGITFALADSNFIFWPAMLYGVYRIARGIFALNRQ